MGQETPSAGLDLGVAALYEQLDTVCALLREASGESFRLVNENESGSEEATRLAPGWALIGSGDARRRAAAAELLGRVLSAEREIESLCTEILDRYEEVTLIQRLGLLMAHTADEDGLAHLVLREISDWLHARAGEIWLRDDDATRLAAAFPADAVASSRLGELGPLVALDECTAWNQGAGSGTEAVVAVPLPADGEHSVGVIVVRGNENERSFSQREIQVLTAVAALASGFLRSHRRAREIWVEEHVGTALGRSRMLQPRRELSFQGLELAHSRIDGRQPGSDYHDVVRTPDGGFAVNLARVPAGGNLAAMHLALAKGLFQSEARSGSSPGRILRRVNDVLSPELIRAELFATAYVARFQPGGRRVDVASAGHATPLLIRRSGEFEEIDVAGSALGLLNALDYDEGGRELATGDVLVFFSDGFVDARSPEGNGLEIGYLGELVSTARNAGAVEIRDRLVGALESHSGGRPIEHDATLVVVKVA